MYNCYIKAKAKAEEEGGKYCYIVTLLHCRNVDVNAKKQVKKKRLLCKHFAKFLLHINKIL